MEDLESNGQMGVPTQESTSMPPVEASDARKTDGGTEHLVLRTEGLVKRYGKRTVVNDVSFEVHQGEIVGLLGPNGAGKTTSFYMTTGLVVPNGGHIYLGEKEITKAPVYRRAKAGIGYLAQEASVFRKMSVEDNIRSVLEMTGKSREEQREHLESLIAEFRLQKVRKNLGDQLSGGERRRTEIARCLAIDPKFIMLDEPFAGVDPIAVEDIQYIVWKLKDRNIGILITAPICCLKVVFCSTARPRNWPKTRWCAIDTSPTLSCCVVKTLGRWPPNVALRLDSDHLICVPFLKGSRIFSVDTLQRRRGLF